MICLDDDKNFLFTERAFVPRLVIATSFPMTDKELSKFSAQQKGEENRFSTSTLPALAGILFVCPRCANGGENVYVFHLFSLELEGLKSLEGVSGSFAKQLWKASGERGKFSAELLIFNLHHQACVSPHKISFRCRRGA